MNQLSYHPEAEDELAEALAYYMENVSEEVASNFDALVEKGVAAIRNAPLRFPLWSRTKARRYVLPEFSFVIFYLKAPMGVHILAVAHTSRRPGYWKSRIAVD